MMDSLQAMSSRRAMVAACLRMKDSTPTDGSKTILLRESVHRCGKFIPVKHSPDEAPISLSLCRVSLVRDCSIGERTAWGKMRQKSNQLKKAVLPWA